MQINIETEKIIKLEISPTEYTVLFLLWQKEYSILEDICKFGGFE